MTDYTFMQSGFDNLESNDIVENVSAIISYFAENSLKTSATYVKHAKRNGITKMDIKKAMQLEVFLFSKRKNLTEEVLQIKNKLKEYDSDDEDLDDLIIPDEELDEFQNSSCSCVLCKTLNNIEIKWSKFNPTEPMQKLLKKHIDAI
tara:strand:- start:404 stop:844 length:441 start_codon:yes stop_codon:yes gene_type:complete